jgi:hypothetical protein
MFEDLRPGQPAAAAPGSAGDVDEPVEAGGGVGVAVPVDARLDFRPAVLFAARRAALFGWAFPRLCNAASATSAPIANVR